MLYESEVFGISISNEVSFDGDEKSISWLDPVFYRQTTFGRQNIRRLPHNVFRLIQNLELNFTDEGILWQSKTVGDLSDSKGRLLWNISQMCGNLRDSFQLQYLDITLSFRCMFEDIESMARLLEPIKELRGINDSNITVFGYESSDLSLLSASWYQNSEPRWGLTDEFTGYLQSLLMSPHGTPTPPSDGLEVFADDHEGLEEHEYHLGECGHLRESEHDPWNVSEVGCHTNWNIMPANME